MTSSDRPDPAVAWAARRMPVLARSIADIGAAFAGLRIAMTIHVEPKTAVLVQALAAAGAEVRITGNVGTTRPDTVAALRRAGVSVLGERDDRDAERSAHLDTLLDSLPDLVLDNGGDLIARLAAGAPRSDGFLGATEETTTGGVRIRGLATPPDFPVIVINDTRLKLLVENEFGVGHSIVQGFMDATNLMVPSLHAGVVGYGPCGKGTADALRALGATVTVADLDPFRRLDAALRGHRVAPLADLLAASDALFLATGARHVVGREHFAELRDGVVVAGVGHDGAELDLGALRDAADEIVDLSPPGGDADARVAYRFADGREVVVLHGTRMLNLTAAQGNPIEAMDLGFALQARSLAAIATGDAGFTGVRGVPEGIERVLAEDVLATLDRSPA